MDRQGTATRAIVDAGPGNRPSGIIRREPEELVAGNCPTAHAIPVLRPTYCTAFYIGGM
jgi:hypothetical protein